MSINSLSVPARIQALKNIFADFGIPVLANSSLDLAIQAEFGRGKRSKLTELLNDLQQGADAGKLAACIGAELQKGTTDPEILAVSNFLQHRVPALLEIVDLRQSSEKRQRLLSQLLEHFVAKIPDNPQTERTVRMLQAAQKNLTLNTQVRMVGEIAAQSGSFFAIADLKQAGKIFQALSPALLALDQPDYPLEQKVNHCLYALRVLAMELHSTQLSNAANILDNIHWLAKVTLPEIADQATIDQALQNLGISVGVTSTQLIQAKAVKAGLTAKEVVQIIYASRKDNTLPANDQELLQRTQQNQQYAAICGFLAKLAQDAKVPQLEQISIAGICAASMRQTFYELKTANLGPVNFSESLGTILLGLGTITHNNTLAHIGKSILSGVAAYAGVMAVPGGQVVAIPLAICSVLGKLFLEPRQEANAPVNISDALSTILQQIVVLQQQMRVELASLYQEIAAQHGKILTAIDHGYSNLSNLVRYNNAQILINMRALDQKLQDLQLQINAEFSDLYLEYVHDPLQEVDYATRYGVQDPARAQDSKHKLAMWLLYKSKHPKVCGGNFALENLTALHAKLPAGDACLALINRYVNQIFAQQLPEDLPHIPTWLQAALAYTLISAQISATPDADPNTQFLEEQFLNDVLAIGNKTINFVEQLAQNTDLWQRLNQAIQNTQAQIQARWALLQLQTNPAYLQSINTIVSQTDHPPMQAHAAPISKQLEPFTAINVDISDLWREHIEPHIPAEFFSAVTHGLGNWQIEFCVDKSNTFTDVHIPYGSAAMPSHAREVTFTVNVYFKACSIAEPQLLTTAHFAYALQDARQRFDEYYQQKFKYGLRHTKYHWVSIDGLSNQVEGHGNTSTQKLIDYDRLATLYANWLRKAHPIKPPQMHEQLVLLRLQLHNELRALMQQQRVTFAAVLQQDQTLSALIEKLDVYKTIAAIYLRLLNKPFNHAKQRQKFAELLNALQQADTVNLDLAKEFALLFLPEEIIFEPGTEYAQGEFYIKMQTAITRLGLLQTKTVLDSLTTIDPVVMPMPRVI